MTQSPYPETSPDPYERFPVYNPDAFAEPTAEPAALPVPYTPPQPIAQVTTPPVPVQPLTDQQPPSTALLVVAWVVAVATGFYLLPWAIAATRGKSNQWGIFAGNLLLGWTVVGWIVALVKACGAHRLIAPVQQYYAITAAPAQSAPPGWYPLPDGTGSRYWDGQAWTAAVRR